MNLFQTIILTGLIGNSVLGVFVLQANPRRAVNVGFFILTVMAVLWLGSMFFCSLPHSDFFLLFWIRQTSAFGGLIPLSIFVLQYAIMHPDVSLLRSLYFLRYWLLAGFSVFLLCHSSVFVISARNPTAQEMVPVVQYGWGFSVFIAFFFIVIIALIYGFWKAGRDHAGIQKEEIQFLQMGCVLGLISGVFFLTLAEVLKNQEISRFLPLSALILDGFVAYGIATRRIFTVSTVLQRVAAYALMTFYLILLYILTEWIVAQIFALLIADTAYLSHLVAALVIAFSVAPAHGWMQTFARRLFPNSISVNVDEVLTKASHIFQEVAAEDRLAELFAGLIIETFGTVRLTLLRPDSEGDYRQTYPPCGAGKAPLRIRKESDLVRLLQYEHEAVTADMLQRMRPTPEVERARLELESLNSTAVLGSFMRREMKAVLLLSPKKSGRIYDLHDQRALQLLCDQFAVAMENSSLYTAVQNGKIYNDILLDSLASGIVAVNFDRTVTVFNQQAQNLTGLGEDSVVNHPMEILPPALSRSLEATLATEAGFRDRNLSIARGDEEVPIRVSGSAFYGHTGNLLGALLVFNDMTLLKKMEEQIRRSDRLSSIGTLAAGMAHEIKNPLVTIKTFTQLLPQQYKDSDFRQTFFDLVGQEVMRIDTIVNRLLNFSRPAKASLEPVSLHEVIENSLRLVEQKLLQNEIVLRRELGAQRHLIEADAEQLNQTLINFFLNAVHAMREGGTLTVCTKLVKPLRGAELMTGDANGVWIEMDIRDTGSGISPENLNKIFDPFFTTKEDGIGLGLSVSYGIIQEHKGTIDVESEEGKGTVFRVQFPLLTPQEKQDV